MRSGIHGTFATLLLMVPVLSIPALAIFGIPQFAPVVASPLDEGASRDRERRVGKSERPAADDFLSDLDDDASDTNQSSRSRNASLPPGRMGDSVPLTRSGRNAPAWDSADSDVKQSLDESPRTESWGDDLKNGNHRASGTSGKLGSSNQSMDRSDFDQRFSAATMDAKQSTQQPMSRDRRSDLVPAERTVPRQYQRERETASIAATPLRQIANTHEPVTWQSAIRRLNDLEIRNFRLERGHGENQFIFICSYTPSDSPRVSLRFEAQADEPLKAVEKVLEQISEWQERR